MDNMHARHMQELAGNRHRQEALMQQILRVMQKVELLHSHHTKQPWTAEEDEVASGLRVLRQQLQNPSHPLRAIDHLAPRVRLATDAASGGGGRADSKLSFSVEDQRAIAEILAEQSKGLQFIRDVLETDTRHMQLIMERVRAAQTAPPSAFGQLSLHERGEAQRTRTVAAAAAAAAAVPTGRGLHLP